MISSKEMIYFKVVPPDKLLPLIQIKKRQERALNIFKEYGTDPGLLICGIDRRSDGLEDIMLYSFHIKLKLENDP